MTATTIGRDHLGTFVIHEGRKAWRSIGTADDLRAEAIRYQQDAAEAAYRARRAAALASIATTKEAERKTAASTKRKRKAAATRAHNANPFGFPAHLA